MVAYEILKYLQPWSEKLKTFPGRLNQLEKGQAYLNLKGFPTRIDEDWRYLNIKQILNRAWIPSGFNGQADIENNLAKILQENSITEIEIKLVFRGGALDLNQTSELAVLNQYGLRIEVNGVEVTDSVGSVDHLYCAQNLKESPVVENSFGALNQIFYQNSVKIILLDNKKVDRPIHCYFVTDGKEGMMSSPKIDWHIGRGAEAQFIMHYLSLENDQSEFVNFHEFWKFAIGSRVEITHLLEPNYKSFLNGRTQFEVEPEVYINSVAVSLGGLISRHQIDVSIGGTNAEVNLNGLYFVKCEQVIDFHTFISHRIGGSKSQQLYKGILKDSGKAIFNGKVHIGDNAQEAYSTQLNKNLLLSPLAEVNSKPEMDIFADNVVATHGATIGQLNQDELFYLQSRAIDKKHAVELMTIGFANEILMRVENSQVSQFLIKKVMGHYGA